MLFNSPDINTFKAELDNNIQIAQNVKGDTHASIKVQSLLNITIYALACRFLEGSVKILIYNCAIMRGDNATQLNSLENELKKLNNPEYANIRDEILKHLNFDINNGKVDGYFSDKDISLLNEIVKNRHKNVHASHEPTTWFSTNIKDIINDFPKEYPGLINILKYLDNIRFDGVNSSFTV
jgi:hypothetical protein